MPSVITDTRETYDITVNCPNGVIGSKVKV
jgi:hypothetical protein